MSKICFVDLDGVVADPSERFKRAEEAKQEYQTAQGMGLVLSILQEKKVTDLYWRTVFTPELIALDTLIDDAKGALETLRYKHGYELIFLTSRPDTLRQATLEWLYQQNILFFSTYRQPAIVMKAPAFQFVKTVAWKAGMIQTLVTLYGAEEVLVVDDEAANLAELQKYDVSRIRLCSSLAEAIAPPSPEEDRPF